MRGVAAQVAEYDVAVSVSFYDDFAHTGEDGVEISTTR